jgi:uncharacterized protein YjbI with pentapeptide repeats
MPFADAPISFLGFMIVAPLLLIVLAVYLHIFFGYWLDLERERQEINRSLASTNEAPVESVPSLFSYTDPMSRLLTASVFYWLVPLVLTVITWKAAGRPDLGRSSILIYVTGLVTCALFILRIRRCPDSQRRWRNPPRWAILCVVTALLVLAAFKPQAFNRSLNLYRADLKDAWLQDLNMCGADVAFANLQGANIEWSNLSGADLWRADLRGANLKRANLSGADLLGANLRGANLSGADLRGAKLRFADLRGVDLQEVDLRLADFTYADLEGADLREANLGEANLEEANLRGVDLRGVKNLTREQLTSAKGDENTKLPNYLGPPKPPKP